MNQYAHKLCREKLKRVISRNHKALVAFRRKRQEYIDQKLGGKVYNTKGRQNGVKKTKLKKRQRHETILQTVPDDFYEEEDYDHAFKHLSKAQKKKLKHKLTRVTGINGYIVPVEKRAHESLQTSC